jgi:hypothetical protein
VNFHQNAVLKTGNTPGATVLPQAVIPGYARNCWEMFYSRPVEYREKLAYLSAAFRMSFDSSNPPFVFAGDIQSPGSKILAFGLAPHAAREKPRGDLLEEHRWRLAYFEQEAVPHGLHRYFAKLLRGVMEPAPSSAQFDARWLRHNGYAAFDLLPFYVKDWRTPDWEKAEVMEVVKSHFSECLNLVAGADVRLAVFSGKPWQELLVGGDSPPRLGGFRSQRSFLLRDVTAIPRHSFRISLGTLAVADRPIPAVVVGALLHQIRTFGYARAEALGAGIRSALAGAASEREVRNKASQ